MTSGLPFTRPVSRLITSSPLKGNVFVSVNIEQKNEVIPIARQLRDLGLTLYGHRRDLDYLHEAGVEVHLVRKVQEGSPMCST